MNNEEKCFNEDRKKERKEKKIKSCTKKRQKKIGK